MSSSNWTSKISPPATEPGAAPAARLGLAAQLGRLLPLAGAVYGLGLARSLFERFPQTLGPHGAWLAAVLLAAGGLGGTWALAAWLRSRNPSAPWALAALALPVAHLWPRDVNELRGAVLLAAAPLLALALLHAVPLHRPGPRARPDRDHRSDTLLSLFLFLCLFLLYLLTLAPAVGEADTFEFQVGIARLGVAHGSGYPLLMLVGKVFTLLPIGGTLAFRANLTSAFFGALAAVFVARLARRLGAAPVTALLAGLTIGVSPTLWSRAVEVEAYTLNAALVAGLLYLGLSLAAQPWSARRLYLLAGLFGLSLTNHLTTLLLLPALGLAVAAGAFRSARRQTPTPTASNTARGAVHAQVPQRLSSFQLPASSLRTAALACLACLLGLSVYLYIPLRWPAVNDGEWLSWAQLANILTGNEAKGAFQPQLPFRDFGRYSIVFSKVAGEYGLIGLGLALLGLAALAVPAYWRGRANRPYGAPVTSSQPGAFAASALLFPIYFLLAYLAYAYFALSFNVPDPDFSAFLIPLHLIAAVLLGLGLQAVLAVLSRAGLHALHYPLLVAYCLLPLSLVWRTLPRVDQSRDWSQHRLGEYILRQPLAAGATILADSQKIAPLYYLQVAEGLRPDLDIVVLPDEASYRAVLDERVAQGQSVYLGRYLPGLGGGYALRSVGPLAEVSPVPFDTAPPAMQPAAAQPQVPGLRLLGFALAEGDSLSVAPSDPLRLTLAWQVEAAVDEHLLVYLRLVDSAGQVARQSAGNVPVGGLYPTNAWRRDEIVTDFHALPLGHDLRPGRYQLEIGLFPPFAAGEAGWSPVTAVEVLPPRASPPVPHPLRARLGQHWLMGYALPESAAPGARVPVTLYWLRAAPSEDVVAFGQEHSLAAWPVGMVVPVRYELTAPAAGDLWPLTVEAGSPAYCGWLQSAGAGCALPPVRLAGQAAAEGSANFGNQLLLNRATLETPRVRPGEQAHVVLEWQGLQRMAEDYTVFVHLLGPDGLVHGQVDSWPVSGTLATSRWEPGQVVRDPYAITVPPDAPPGEYQVEIGLYLLATGERRPVLNSDGLPVDDKVLLGGLTIVP